MPVITVITNAKASVEQKIKIAKALNELVATEVRVPAGHVHVLIQDEQFFSFGDDLEKPAVYLTVKSSALQILPEARRNLVADFVPALQAALPDLSAWRVNTMFEELPVECIAVGSNIATFGAPKSTGGSARNSLGGGPTSPKPQESPR
ncbi:hypothetical protein HYH03_018008 [Edaphochlamys debaryana]|uniref:Uncharacterized protein n=1 Tax=Edaphochlamys debaryana TaxID=47281 RepID=A0A836BQ01_9CHLO|nr:hypothetical protein HYH03_018008 [Edaphochlamys debaryana]|eukprot:KAG2483118.1 hypothetical protein HYH03_018008 [Edaphochlamys debaryana]